MYLYLGTTHFVVKQGDITKETADVIVNAANSSLLGGGGVDGAIHRAGGPDILRACREIRAGQGGCPTGQAVITTAGRLDAQYVVHTVGPVWNGGSMGEPDLLRSCYLRSLELAAHHGAQSIAFPSISTGAYGYPIGQAAPVALGAARDFAVQNAAFAEIRFVLFFAADLGVYQQSLADLSKASRSG